MNQQAEQSIIEMMNNFPQTSQDYRLLLVSLGKLCAGLGDRAIIEAAERFASGDVKDQSKKFAPSTAEFIEEARRRQEYHELLARPRLPAPEVRPSGRMPPFLIRKQKALAENSHLPVLLENISFEEFRRLSAAKQIPFGAKWVASLATVFGPEQAKKSQAA